MSDNKRGLVRGDKNNTVSGAHRTAQGQAFNNSAK